MSKCPIPLNEPIEFEGSLWRAFYFEYMGWRAPKKGEYFLSGAIITAYRAYSDMTRDFHVVRPTHVAQRVTGWQRGAIVTGGDVRNV